MPGKPRVPKQKNPFLFEYVTSTVALLEKNGQGDGIVVQVLNDSVATTKAQALIYQNGGGGAVVVVDSGLVDLPPTWAWSLIFTIAKTAEYWVRIRAASEFSVPSVNFERADATGMWLPVARYLPGDFATFKLKPARRRIW